MDFPGGNGEDAELGQSDPEMKFSEKRGKKEKENWNSDRLLRNCGKE